MVARRILILLIVLLSVASACLHSQSAYVNTQHGIFRLPDGANGSRVLISGNKPDSNILSLTIFKDTIYYSTWDGEVKRFKIGSPETRETLLFEEYTYYSSMTVDKNGIIYMATDMLVRFNPYTRELTNLGRMPFISGGDMLFYKDKLLLAGWDANWNTGIFEIDPDNLDASKLYMSSPLFIGLMSHSVSCGVTKYFGLHTDLSTATTTLIELDLEKKTVIGQAAIIPEEIYDAASPTETGRDNKITIDAISGKNPDNCGSDNGSINITASTVNESLTYTFLNTGTSQSAGNFTHLKGGVHMFRITDAAGCSKDTSFTLAENIPLPSCNEIFIPNAFTPNNDGKNDYFSFTLPASCKDIHLQVYGRWGNAVFSAKGNSISWDGSSRGAKQPTGVYIYTLAWTGADGEQKNLKGTLTLIR